MSTENPPAYHAHLKRGTMTLWLIVAGLALVLEILIVASESSSWIDYVLLFCITILCAAIALQVFDKRPVLIVDADGVLDRRLSRRKIVWADMLWHELKPHGPVPLLAIGLTDQAARQAGLYPWSFIYKNQKSPLSALRGYRIWPMRTHGDPQSFIAAVRAFEPRRG